MVVRTNKSWRDWGVLRSVRSWESNSSVEGEDDDLLSAGIVAARRLTRPVADDIILLIMVFGIVLLRTI